MKRLFIVLAAVLMIPFTLSAQTADQIIAKALEGRGGLARIKAVQSLRVTGTISFGPGAQGPFVVELARSGERARPGKMHMEMTLPAGKIIRVYDGKANGWAIYPFGGNRGVQSMNAEDIQNIAEESDFDGPFVDSKEKGNAIELSGKEDVDGKPAYRLKVTTKNGAARSYLVDAASYQLIKWEGARKQDDREIPVESFFKDYREVNGLKFAFEIDSGAPGQPAMQKIIVEKVEVDPKIDEARFAKPPEPAKDGDPPASH